jgi:predicted signal transduction protein with EAL and GGDEF domain
VTRPPSTSQKRTTQQPRPGDQQVEPVETVEAVRWVGERTLRGTWRATVGVTFGMLLLVVTVAAVAIGHQHATFVDTTSALGDGTDAFVDLELTLLGVTDPIVTTVYRAGDTAAVTAARAELSRAQIQVDLAFDEAATTMLSPAAHAELDLARRSWGEVVDAVDEAEATWTDEELQEFLSTGADPFMAAVWIPYDNIRRHVALVRADAMVGRRAEVAAAERVQRAAFALFAGAVLTGGAGAMIMARRMSRRVLAPLSAVSDGARSMQDPTHSEPIAVPGAVREVRNLAITLNETSASLRRSHRALHTQTLTDTLTGLPNRLAFTGALTRTLADRGDWSVTVMFVDLDDFKDVNDSMGHAAGDELLRIIGRRLRSVTRAHEVVARLGGDEFAVVATGAGRLAARPGPPSSGGPDQPDASARDADSSADLAERILTVVSAPVDLHGRTVTIGCSVGVAISDPYDTEDDADTLLGNADFAMYLAKSQGKNRSEVHSSQTHTEMLARMNLRQDLARAVEQGQLELHHQPVVDLDTEEIIGFEALVRWQHPIRGLIPPGDFIPIAEETGAIVGIGAWVLDEGCRGLAELHRHDPALRASINVAPQELLSAGYADRVVATAARHGIPVDRLVLEITEATAMTCTGTGLDTLTELRRRGIHIALDDFGTGFSSLSYLNDLPADILKVDRSFITGHKPDSASMLDSIITLAQRLGKIVVVEGIETPDELERTSSYRDLYGQGFLFHRPMPGAELLSLVARGSQERETSRR